MQRRVLLLCAFLLAGVVSAAAQITFDRSYFEQQVGQTITSTTYQMDTQHFPSLDGIAAATGANQTYDFSGFTYVIAGNVAQPILTSAAGTPGENDPDFGNANFIQYLDYGGGSGFWSYFDLSDEGYDYMGSYYQTPTGSQVNKNSPYDRIWQFPMTAGSMWEQSIVVHTEGFGVELTTNITETNVIDGWGMLITPAGSAPCIRLRKTRVDETAGKTATTNDTYFFLTNSNISASISYNSAVQGPLLATHSVLGGVGTANEELPVPEFRLAQNFPNPFTRSTTIRFDLGSAAHADLRVYDLMGREVTRLVDAMLPAGSHSAQLSAEGLSDGMYVYRLSVNGVVSTRTVALLRQ